MLSNPKSDVQLKQEAIRVVEVIKLKSGKNFRDLGGVKLKDGSILPTGKYLRGKTMFGFKQKDIDYLVQNYGLKTIIDLRTNQEMEEKPNPPIEGVTFIHMPIFNEATAGITREYGTNTLGAIRAMASMQDVYRSMTEEQWLDNLAAVLIKILTLNDEQLPVLFHCSVGKDRTGIIAALLLFYFGASEEDIIYDYLYTNKTNKVMRFFATPFVLATMGSVKMAKKAVGSLRADIYYYNAFFDGIKSKYGTVENFLEIKVRSKLTS